MQMKGEWEGEETDDDSGIIQEIVCVLFWFTIQAGLKKSSGPWEASLRTKLVDMMGVVELCQILTVDAVKVLYSICQQIWKTQQWPQDWKRSVFIPIPKKGNAK